MTMIDLHLRGADLRRRVMADTQDQTARQISAIRAADRLATIAILFTGVLGAGLPGMVEVPFPCHIEWAHLYACDDGLNPQIVTAQLELQLSQLSTFEVNPAAPLSGTGAQPALVGADNADLDLTGWTRDLIAGNLIKFRIASFSGAATCLALNILVRSTPMQINGGIVDAAGDTVIDSAGEFVVPAA